MRHLILISLFALSTQAFGATETDTEVVKACLDNWKTHPFPKNNPDFRVISPKVKVMGIGGRMAEEKETSSPELVLIKSNVNVMSKNIIKLANPNGWYCLQNKVDVMAKTEIELNCNAHLTSSNTEATILKQDDDETGVTVLGKTVVKRDCTEKSGNQEKGNL